MTPRVFDLAAVAALVAAMRLCGHGRQLRGVPDRDHRADGDRLHRPQRVARPCRPDLARTYRLHGDRRLHDCAFDGEGRVALPCGDGRRHRSRRASSAVILAMPALRVRGPYLAMVTIAFGFIVEHGTIEWRDLTGGGNGLILTVPPSVFGFQLSERSLAIAGIVLVVRQPHPVRAAEAQRLGLRHARSPRHRGCDPLGRHRSRAGAHRGFHHLGRRDGAGRGPVCSAAGLYQPELVPLPAVDSAAVRRDGRRRRLCAWAGDRRCARGAACRNCCPTSRNIACWHSAYCSSPCCGSRRAALSDWSNNSRQNSCRRASQRGGDCGWRRAASLTSASKTAARLALTLQTSRSRSAASAPCRMCPSPPRPSE